MRWLLPLILLAGSVPAANAGPPQPERPVMVRFSVPLTGGADRPAWEPVRPEPPSRFTGADIAKNLSEGWLGIGILAVGGAVWVYQANTD